MTDHPERIQARPTGDRRSQWRKRLQLLALALILLAPSVWMLANLPPLLRDADAYHQLATSPGRATAGGHGPLYSLVARVPLYLGFEWERLRGSSEAAPPSFYRAPVLTDTGIYLLIGAQHLALCVAVLALILSASTRVWIRLMLALFFVSNHLFYTFAQCVGSESLGMICILVFATIGLRLVKGGSRPSWKMWSLCAVSLLACILARYANLLLLFALPIAFFLSAAVERKRAFLLSALLALVIALGCAGAANRISDAVCRFENLRYFSKIGFTFLWRAGFLQAVPEPARSALLDRVSARTKTADGRKMIDVLRELLREGMPVEAGPIAQRLRAVLFPPGTKVNPRQVHRALNDVARAFLLPPTAEHWSAAHRDFVGICRTTPPVMSRFLFGTTTYFWDHPAELPECARLATFRDYTAASIQAIPVQSRYLQLWSMLSLKVILVAWLVATFVLLSMNGGARSPLRAICFYSIALVCAGLAMIEMTGLIGQLIPRYTLPLWELLWISGVIYAGALGEISDVPSSGAVTQAIGRSRTSRENH